MTQEYNAETLKPEKNHKWFLMTTREQHFKNCYKHIDYPQPSQHPNTTTRFKENT